MSGFAVVSPGTLTTVQDWPGRLGYRSAGVPTSGPMDDLSFRLGNLALGNAAGAAGLEMTLAGPALRFHSELTIMVTGAPTPVMIDARPAEQWVPQVVPAGALVEIGVPRSGMRSYLLVGGGIAVPQVMGSAATLPLASPSGGLEGLAGRPLRPGDVLPVDSHRPRSSATPVPPQERTPIGQHWRLAVLEGPHGAPQFFTEADVEEFFATQWTVQLDAARTGVQLSGPKPSWARRDGGDAGLHPTDIQHTPYAVGAVSYPGDQPVVLGPDGASLGRSTSPATVISGDRWKLGQLRPGNTVQFVPICELQADDIRRQLPIEVAAGRPLVVDGGILMRLQATRSRPKVTFRRSGDDNLLIEYGEMTLDLELRMRVHALAEAVAGLVRSGELTGIVDVTPGIRSLQLHVDPDTVPITDLLCIVRAVDEALPPTRDLVVPSRTVRLPLAWADPATEGTGAEMPGGSNGGGPWCPSSLEYLRRINGLSSVEDVCRIVFAAEYLVLGLGEGHLGGPVATPLDPRHRLVTTRFEPPLRDTPTDAVCLGGGYLGISGPGGPGDGQLLGRTVPIWSASQHSGREDVGAPGLLRCFDRISWYRVSPEELATMRAGSADQASPVTITDGRFSMADYDRFQADHLDSIAEATHRQTSAFADHRLAWRRAGLLDRPQLQPDTTLEWVAESGPGA